MFKQHKAIGGIKRTEIKHLITPKHKEVLKFITLRLEEAPEGSDVYDTKSMIEYIKNYNSTYGFYSEPGLYYLTTFDNGKPYGRYLLDVVDDNIAYIGYHMEIYHVVKETVPCELGFSGTEEFIDKYIKAREIFGRPFLWFGVNQTITFTFIGQSPFKFSGLSESK